jgi:hypothetical protein
MGAIIVIAIIIIILACAIAQSREFYSLPELSTSATVIAKEKVKVIVRNSGDGDSIQASTTERIEHKVTFETDNHLRWTFDITPGKFDSILQGDSGTLIYKEHRQKLYFVNFKLTNYSA